MMSLLKKVLIGLVLAMTIIGLAVIIFSTWIGEKNDALAEAKAETAAANEIAWSWVVQTGIQETTISARDLQITLLYEWLDKLEYFIRDKDFRCLKGIWDELENPVLGVPPVLFMIPLPNTSEYTDIADLYDSREFCYVDGGFFRSETVAYDIYQAKLEALFKEIDASD